MNWFIRVAALLCLLLAGCNSESGGKPANPALTKQLATAITMGDGPEVSRLVAAGADVEHGERPDVTPLQMAVFLDHQDIVERLLAAGAKIDTATSKGVTPLFQAAMFGNTKIAALLVDKGANVNARNSVGTSVLIMAVTEKNEEICRRLIEKGADVQAQTGGHQTTAMMMAADADLLETAKLLIAKGASATVKDAHGKSALDYAKTDAMKSVLGAGK